MFQRKQSLTFHVNRLVDSFKISSLFFSENTYKNQNITQLSHRLDDRFLPLSLSLFVYLSVCLSVCLCLCLSLSLSLSLSHYVCVSACLSLSVSVSVSIFHVLSCYRSHGKIGFSLDITSDFFTCASRVLYSHFCFGTHILNLSESQDSQSYSRKFCNGRNNFLVGLTLYSPSKS